MDLTSYTEQKTGCCNIVRTFVVTVRTMNIVSGYTEPTGESQTITGPCNTPLFGKGNGVCEACRTGWEVPGNLFADANEKKRAMQ